MMYGFSQGFFKDLWRKMCGTKEIKLAVIGTPSSGKSFLLYDIINSLTEYGFKDQNHPLDFPYSNFADYFTDITDAAGGVLGTKTYACRQENHYGAMLHGSALGKDIDIEFLNIPGETFSNPKRVALFFALKDAIARQGKGIFTVTTWKNPGGEKQYVVAPSETLRQQLGLPEPNKNLTAKIVEASYKQKYGDWDTVYSVENNRMFKEVKGSTTNRSGKYILDNFHKFVPDSIMQTIKDVWPSLMNGAMNVTRDVFVNNDLDRDFYFHFYCLEATDIVVCDKLFNPSNTATDIEVKMAEMYGTMTQQIKQFLTQSKRHPNVYLAFRGADMMLDESALQDLAQKLNVPDKEREKHAVYSSFLHSLFLRMWPDRYNYPAQLGGWIGASKDADLTDIDNVNLLEFDRLVTLSKLDLEGHITSRMGTRATGFWSLLSAVSDDTKVSNAMNRFPIAPHVYFTSTPIDARYRIYLGDPNHSYQRFIRNENGREIAFHAVNSFLNFGSSELVADILVQHGISQSAFRTGGLLRSLQTNLK